jgi:hypothetical protein
VISRATREAPSNDRGMRATVAIIVLAACGADPMPMRSPQQRVEDSAPAIAALQASSFDQAGRAAQFALDRDPYNSRAAAVHAITTYRQAGHELFLEIEKLGSSAFRAKALDHESGRAMWKTFLARLDDVDRDLAIVAKDPDFSLELCLACWVHDWNRSGEIDDNDRKMFEIEFDGQGGELADGDPRRRPTYHFDIGDADWARAMIAFQRAAIEIVLAYKWSELDKLFGDEEHEVITIRIDDKSRVRRAHRLILDGLDYAERCRTAYLAETDDDREWVPNPRQKSFAMPLPVDDALYETWLGVLGDVRRMLKSKEGISLREAQGVLGSDDTPVPDIFIDLGAMLREPKDIVFDLKKIERSNIDGILKDVLGNGYRKKMTPSPIVARFRRMAQELSRGEDTFERKLRYLMWLN